MSYPDRLSYDFDSIIGSKAEFRELMDIGLLYPHQELVRRYMSPYTPYNSLLLYHSMGTGKTFICIAIAEDHYKHSGKKCIVLTKGSTSKNSYISQIMQWLRKRNINITTKEMRQYISDRYIFGNHISFCKHKLSCDIIDPNISNNIILVIDEVHNINPSTGNVINPIYENLKRYIHNLTNSKILLLSGTPLVNDTRKLLSILPMILSPNIHVNNEMVYNVNILRKIAKGFVSYYQADISSASVHYNGVIVPNTKYPTYISHMKGVQKRVCEELSRLGTSDTIYINSVNASLFVFNDGKYGSKIDNTVLIPKTVIANDFISAFMGERRSRYKCKRYVVNAKYIDQINMDNLSSHSCKYYSIISQIQSRDRQCCFVFIREVMGSGLLLFSAILESLGYELYYGQELSNLQRRRRYSICVGERDISPNNKDRIAGFNNTLNIHGEYVQVLVGSAVVGESISLLNVRHFHSASPHWNDSVIGQAMKRVIRAGSHDNLPPEERTVDIFLHASYINAQIMSVDLRKLDITYDKELYLDPLRDNLRLISIEHIINTNNISRVNLDCSTYISYITKHMLDRYINDIKYILHHPISIQNISNLLSLPIEIARYSVSQCILDNTSLKDYYGRLSYVREVNGVVSLTRNYRSYSVEVEFPTLVFRDSLEQSKISIPFSTEDFINKCSMFHPIDVIRQMIRLSWDERISVLEASIVNKNPIYNIFSIYIIGNCHIYNYRRPNKGSYKSLLVGIRPKGLTRHLDIDGKWKYISPEKESEVLRMYDEELDNIRTNRSIDSHIYTMSTTDMVIRVIVVDNKYRDRRNYSRGRSLDNLSKDILVKCHNSILGRIGTNRELVTSLIERNLIVYV